MNVKNEALAIYLINSSAKWDLEAIFKVVFALYYLIFSAILLSVPVIVFSFFNIMENHLSVYLFLCSMGLVLLLIVIILIFRAIKLLFDSSFIHRQSNIKVVISIFLYNKLLAMHFISNSFPYLFKYFISVLFSKEYKDIRGDISLYSRDYALHLLKGISIKEFVQFNKKHNFSRFSSFIYQFSEVNEVYKNRKDFKHLCSYININNIDEDMYPELISNIEKYKNIHLSQKIQGF